MDQFWLGAGAIAGLALIGTIAWIVIRLRKLERMTLQAMETIEDEKIKSSTRLLSDAELDALVGKNIGGSEDH